MKRNCKRVLYQTNHTLGGGFKTETGSIASLLPSRRTGDEGKGSLTSGRCIGRSKSLDHYILVRIKNRPVKCVIPQKLSKLSQHTVLVTVAVPVLAQLPCCSRSEARF